MISLPVAAATRTASGPTSSDAAVTVEAVDAASVGAVIRPNSPSEAVRTLRQAGADITIGHDADNLDPFAENWLSNAR